MSEVSIVKYDHGYAQALSRMWGVSSSGWNGYDVLKTPEAIIQEHNNSTYLRVYLAVQEEEVIGYCSLGKFLRDPSALYIALLNVRPEAQGLGVGKELVLRCVEKTKELGYGQLDLYTWPGNTKAVPLYKKCGFFWERRDDSTHLMNFIPLLLHQEALQEFFAKASWYASSTRSLDVVPDGVTKEGFDFFLYSFAHEGATLEVEIERTGRGIRRIETEDYAITVSAPEHKLAFGQSYSVDYQFVNKSGEPLDIVLKGQDHRNIRFNYEYSGVVTHTETVSGSFFVGPIEEEQDSWVTHPAVTTEVWINGKKALFALGIEPRFPVSWEFHVEEEVSFPHSVVPVHVSLKSSLRNDAQFSFSLPEHPLLSWEEKEVTMELRPKEVKTKVFHATLKELFTLEGEIPIRVKMVGEESFEFLRPLRLPFSGYEGALSAKTAKGYAMYYGPYQVIFNTQFNAVQVRYGREETLLFFWNFPKLGKPFSDEFSSGKPSVTMTKEDQDMVLRVIFSSESFPGVQLVSVTRLRGDGTIVHFNELCNCTEEEIPALFLSDTFYLERETLILPYKEQFLHLDGSLDYDLDALDFSCITEPWIYAKLQDKTLGFAWDPSQKLQTGGWNTYLESSFEMIPKGATLKTREQKLFINGFSNWRGFRSFIQQERTRAVVSLTPGNTLLLNQGNPFVTSSFPVELLTENGKATTLSARIGEKEVSLVSKSLLMEAQDPIGVLEYTLDDGVVTRREQQAYFLVKEGQVVTEITKIADQEVYLADNGCLRIKLAPSFSPSLFALETEGKNWLDTSFPNMKTKAWWNPWDGGVVTTPHKLPLRALLKESSSAEFVELPDSKGNLWKGIAAKTAMKDHPVYAGLELIQYYLLLPGSPVLCHTLQYVQNTGSYLKGLRYEARAFVKPGLEYKDSYVELADETVLRSGGHDRGARATFMALGAKTEKRQLVVYTPSYLTQGGPYVGPAFLALFFERELSLSQGESAFTPPSFFLVSDVRLNEKALQGLDQIVFS